MTSAVHVPAWKKLGLKLKNDEHSPLESNGKRHANLHEVSTTVGRAQVTRLEEPKRLVNGGHMGSPALKSMKPVTGSDRSPLTSESSPNSRKRKSVSFTPETKTSDGKGFKHLYDQFLATHPNGKRPTFKPVVGTSGFSTFSSLEDTSHKSKKAKKSKRSRESEPEKLTSSSLSVLPATTYDPASCSATPKTSRPKHNHPVDGTITAANLLSKDSTISPVCKTPLNSAETFASETPITKPSPPLISNGHSQPTNTQTLHLPPWLDYLYTYETSPSTWKYSKSRQTKLLKNTFDLDKLPSFWDPALVNYWKECKSKGTRAKLKEMAEKMIVDGDIEMTIDSTDVSQPSQSTDPSYGSATSSADPISSDNKADLEADNVSASVFVRAADRVAPVNHAELRARFKAESYAKALHDEKRTLLRLAYDSEEKKKEADPAWQTRYAKRKRAAEILRALDGYSKNTAIALDNDDDAATAIKKKDNASNDGVDIRNLFGGYEKVEPFYGTNADLNKLKIHPLKKFARKRKRRTGVPDDDSSSSEAWSLGSGGEEDLGGEEMNRVGLKKFSGKWTGAGPGTNTEGKLREIKRLKTAGDMQVAAAKATSVASSGATSSGVSGASEDEESSGSEEDGSSESGSGESGGGSSSEEGSSGLDYVGPAVNEPTLPIRTRRFG